MPQVPKHVSFIADPHVGNHGRFGGPVVDGVNTRGMHTLATLRRAVDLAVSRDASAFVVLGDVFHYSRPEPALIAGVQQCLDTRVPVMCITGNHDQDSVGRDDNAVATLSKVSQVTQSADHYRVAKIDGFGELVLVPFFTGDPASGVRDILESIPEPTAGVNRVLCLHMGISDSSTPYYLDGSSGHINVEKLAKLVASYGVTHVVAGDWHRHQRWNKEGVQIIQVGTLIPSRFPPNYEHGDAGPMVSIGSDGSVTVDNVAGPRFYTYTEVPKSWPPRNTDSCAVYVKLSVLRDEADKAREWCAAHADDLAGHEVAIKKAQVASEAAQTHEAAVEARSAVSVTDAVRAYIEAMSMAEGVSRESVVTRALSLLQNT